MATELKRILYLTFYFEPDLCAGSFRNTPLAMELQRQTSSQLVEIDLFTTQPNRYATFNVIAPSVETIGNLKIQRIKIPDHHSGFTDQMLSFKAFYTEVLKRTKGQSYDLVFASSSRLFTAYLASRIASRRSIPLYLDIRDLFLDTISDLIRTPLAALLKVPLKWIENKTFSSAHHINLISPGFSNYMESRTDAKLSFYTHGIDPLFTTYDFFPEKKETIDKQKKKCILYAGNIGEGQGLHKIIPQVAESFEEEYDFKIIGDGGARKKLEFEIAKKGCKNVNVINPISREEILIEYANADFIMIHLNNYDAFKKVLPSKIFEVGAIGKPIIAGVGGYAREFISEHLPDTLFFKPGDPASFAESLTTAKGLETGELNREFFIKKFARKRINKELTHSILSYL